MKTCLMCFIVLFFSSELFCIFFQFSNTWLWIHIAGSMSAKRTWDNEVMRALHREQNKRSYKCASASSSMESDKLSLIVKSLLSKAGSYEGMSSQQQDCTARYGFLWYLIVIYLYCLMKNKWTCQETQGGKQKLRVIPKTNLKQTLMPCISILLQS